MVLSFKESFRWKCPFFKMIFSLKKIKEKLIFCFLLLSKSICFPSENPFFKRVFSLGAFFKKSILWMIPFIERVLPLKGSFFERVPYLKGSFPRNSPLFERFLTLKWFLTLAWKDPFIWKSQFFQSVPSLISILFIELSVTRSQRE